MEQKQTVLAQRILSVLIKDERTRDFAFDVLDNNGIVTLSGTVPDDETRQRAEQIVKEQEGVVMVINDLKLKGEGEEGELPLTPR